MKTLHLIGIGLVVAGVVVLAISDGGFAGVVEISDSDEGPVLKVAMKTHLAPPDSDAATDPALPPATDL